MQRRHQEFAWLSSGCHCGIRQLIRKDRAANHRTVCLVHSSKAKKWVLRTFDVVRRALQCLCVLLQGDFAEWPLGTKDSQDNFCKRMKFKVDLVFQINGKLMAVEVHGGAEHRKCASTKKRDVKKQEAWDEEVAQQDPHAEPRCAGPILVVWAPKLVPCEFGGPKSEQAWEQWVFDAVRQHVCKYML